MSIPYTSKHKLHREIRKWADRNREEILERFENKCVKCGATGKLTIHHKEYKEGFEFVEVLCGKCHREFHRRETRKKLLLIILKDIERYECSTLLGDYYGDVKERFDAIEINIVPDTEFIDGL